MHLRNTLKIIKMKIPELTIVDALCILNKGWSNDESKKLFDIADELIRKRAEKLHLEWEKEAIEKRLIELESDNRIRSR